MSLKRIAEELGLSLTTVSRALNGYPEVAAATREAVREAAARLDYQPNATARGLALGRANAVGLVFPVTPGDLGDSLFLEVAAAMGGRFARENIDLLIISAQPDAEMAAYERAIRARRVDAFVVARTRVEDARLALLQERGVPFVAYGRSDGLRTPYAWFDFDNERGARLAAERLLGLGHRRIGYLGAPQEYNFAAQRFAGFGAALSAAGLAPAAVQRVGLDRASGFAAMQGLLALDAPPTAVLVDNHLAGVGAVHAVLSAGLAPGRDVSLIVYGGLDADALVPSAVTAVRPPTPAATGLALAELVLGRLRGEPVEGLQVLRQPALEIGASDGPPAAGARR
ncbi:substrate-binding domain-containing protein [Xylophilus sp.]|uniref:substrate-binding domain-containing protein n=1 Tax=Xylophilus sp. TaxID=2653893 RepID=UPI0013BB922E|nr:substrate-binding domain-containing protein [Xylophilus sp.]KAF1048210.1 MAG: HTH-type transcriptional regulator RafR [Xylophilus sp.]